MTNPMEETLPGPPYCAVGPDVAPGWMARAVTEGGGTLVPLDEAEALLWFHSPSDELAEALARGKKLRWVQLPAAGIEAYASLLDDRHVWTCAKGVFARPVAEHALTLALSGMRGLSWYARTRSWSEPRGVNLVGARVVIVGGGGIAASLLDLLRPFDAVTTVVRRNPRSLHGASRVLTTDGLQGALPDADLVVLALSLTPETEGIIGRAELDLMPAHAWLVNVARGPHVVTDDLVDALEAGSIGGAALDVTDPEPLPEGHPLWSLENCIITPHVGNTPEMHRPLLEAFTRDNVRRYASGEELLGRVDPKLGY